MYNSNFPNPGIHSGIQVERQSSNLIKVIGQGEISVPPDMAQVNIGVITESKVLLEAQQQNSKDIQRVLNSLHALGIPNNKIRTFDYRIDSEYDYIEGKQVFRGFKVTHLLEVKIEDLTKIGTIIDTTIENGANYVSNIQFKSSRKEYYYQQALTAAVSNAIQKAETISAKLRVRLNPIPFRVSEGMEESPRPFYQPGTFVKGATSTSIEPGEMSIKATVTADFHYFSY